MRVFANLFLVLFLADGGVSLLDELVSLLSPVTFLSEVRSILAASVLVMAALVYLCLGIDRRLPKLVYLPLTLFVLLCPLSAWLFPDLAGNRTYGLIASVTQVALVLFPLSCFRKNGRGSLTMPPAKFHTSLFSLKNTLVFYSANLIVIPVVLTMLVLHTANTYMAKYTSGFIRLAPDGLYMADRVYRRDNRTIRLAGMIHMGEKGYYDNLAGSVARGRTIVLAEGVSDDKNLLRNKLNYGRLAGFLGLTSQDKMLFRGKLIEPEVLETPQVRSGGAGEKEKPGSPDILRADVDVSVFRPPTILFLNTVGKQLQESRSLAKGILAINNWAEKNITREMNDVIMEDILYRRNREVIRHLGKALDRYDNIIIPWGAMHMKEIEEDVLKRGFKLQEQRERVSIDFRKMLLGTL
jgi:hypothetical protein